MLYFAQKLYGAAGPPPPAVHKYPLLPEHACLSETAILEGGEVGDKVGNPAFKTTDQDTVEAPQPTLSEILQALQKCTASVDLKERFLQASQVGLPSTQDLKKCGDCTMADLPNQ